MRMRYDPRRQPGRQIVEVWAEGKLVETLFRKLPRFGDPLTAGLGKHYRRGVVSRIEPGVCPSETHPGQLARVYLTVTHTKGKAPPPPEL